VYLTENIILLFGRPDGECGKGQQSHHCEEPCRTQIQSRQSAQFSYTMYYVCALF